MKTIGIIGGVGWASTMEYYRRFNETINEKFGGLTSAEILMYSLNFQEIIDFQKNSDFQNELKMLKKIALTLESAGADVLIITSNTTSKTFDEIKKSINIPIVNVIDVTINKILQDKIKNVGVLGTQSVMYTNFYKNKFEESNIHPIFPPKDMGLKLNDIIYNELIHNIIKKESVTFIKDTISYLVKKEKVDAIVLGCTELPLAVTEKRLHGVKIFDTIQIHVDETIDKIIN
jgi:aspartate racemase